MRPETKIIFLMLVLLSACSPRNEVVAVVDGFRITKGDVEDILKIEKANYDPLLLNVKQNVDALKEGVLERLVQEAVVLNEAGRLGISVSEERIEDAARVHLNPDIIEGMDVDPDKWREKQRRKMVEEALIEKVTGEASAVTDKEIENYYKENKKDFSKPEQFHALRIVVDDKEGMHNVVEHLKKGADFSFLASEFSVSPDSNRGGDLGFFDIHTFPSLYIKVCSGLKEGEISDVISIDYGYMLLRLIEKKPARQLLLSEVKGQIEKFLKAEKSKELFGKWLLEARGRARITINKDILEAINVK